MGLVRDRFTVELIASHLGTDKELLVEFGGSHFPTMRPALELLLGKVIERRAGVP